MRKLLSVLVLISLLIFFTSSFKKTISYGYNSNDLNQAYSEYVSSTSKYGQDLSSFNLAKGRHQTFKTISSEIEAISATKQMLSSKVELVKNYLTFIRIKLAKETGIIDYRENLNFVQLDNKIVDILSLKEKISTAQSLDELEEVEKDFEERFISAKKLSFKTLTLINIQNFPKYIESLLKITKELNEKISEIKNSANYDTQPILNRLSEIEKNLNNKLGAFNLASKSFINKIDSLDDPEQSYSEFEEFLRNFKIEVSSLLPQLEEVINLLRNIG